MNMEPALNCASSNTTFRKHNELEHRFYLYFYFTLFYLTLPFTTSPLLSSPLLSSPLFSSLLSLLSSLLYPLPPPFHLTISVLLKNRVTRPWFSHSVAAVNQVWNGPKVLPSSLTPFTPKALPPHC
jgi:hypothetical protein